MTSVAFVTASANDSVLSAVSDIVIASRTELLLFSVAIATYFVLFMQRAPHLEAKRRAAMKKCEVECNEADYPSDAYESRPDVQDTAVVEKAFQSAFEAGDSR